MVSVERFCIDRYEAPGILGVKPLVAQTAYEGEAYCRNLGKRLCTQDEWERACRGPEPFRFPYGNSYVPSLCNEDKTWREVDWKKVESFPSKEGIEEVQKLDQSEAAGSRPGCVSAEGVYDLLGNVSEWVVRSRANRTNHEHVLKGWYWVGTELNSRRDCGFTNQAHAGSFRTYDAGIRCCQNALHLGEK